jgi:glucose-6-phosphate isomerase
MGFVTKETAWASFVGMIELRNLKHTDESLKKDLEDCWRQVLAREEVGFTKIPELGPEWKALDDRLSQVRPSRRVLVVGIGGSSLGAQVIYEALRMQRPVQMTFLESPDPDLWTLQRGFSEADWRDKHVVIISKSGNTLETLSWVERLNNHEPNWLKTSQVTVVASPGNGSLQKWAKRENIHTLWIPENVGGRFSVLTAAGMWPAGLMGLKLNEFREGAAWALKRVDLASALSVEILNSWKRGEWVSQMWTYSEALRLFGDWWQQLWSESLGKRTSRKGDTAPRVSTPMSCRGPRDQHSLVQQLVEASDDKFIFVTRVRAVENAGETFTPVLFPEMPFHGRPMTLGRILGAEAQAFERSLIDSQVPFCTLAVEKVTERSLGGLFMLWQMVIAQLGEYLQVDAYDQPGVEIGKKHATQILAQ